MKRFRFILLFIGTNIFFIFLQIHKSGKITQISYQNQSKQHELDKLTQKKEVLTHQLQAMKNPATIKKYAAEELKMKNISLQQIHVVNLNNNNGS